MATPKKRYKYTFLYTDGTYLTYELTREDYEHIVKAFTPKSIDDYMCKFIHISIGIISAEGIRSIIEQKEPEQEAPEAPEEAPMENLPVLDQESFEWLKQFAGGNG